MLNRFLKKNFLLFTIFFIIFSLFLFIYIEFFLIKKNFSLEIKKGDTSYTIARKLNEDGIISCKLCFLGINIILNKLNIFLLKEGEYEFNSTRLSDFFLQISSNKTKKYLLKITEGLTLLQIKKIIENAPFLSGKISENTLNNWQEGFFMPDTYFVEKNFDRDSFVLMGINEMNNFLNKVWQNNSNSLLNNKKELLILASIVEAETPLTNERNEVAGVYLNRLKNNIPLCADPVLIYYETNNEMCGQFTLFFKHLKTRHNYNVYINKGLPPTPICNPSRESILAVLNANNTENLYFVATGNGGHFFSKTFEEHKENIKIYKQNLRNNFNKN